MPLYEYECEACAHRFERIQKFSDPPIEVCPVCGSHVRKLLSTPAIQFKGTGWYVTDYAKKSGSDSSKGSASKGDAKSADTSSTDASASKSDAKSSSTSSTPTKTESKSESK